MAATYYVQYQGDCANQADQWWVQNEMARVMPAMQNLGCSVAISYRSAAPWTCYVMTVFDRRADANRNKNEMQALLQPIVDSGKVFNLSSTDGNWPPPDPPVLPD